MGQGVTTTVARPAAAPPRHASAAGPAPARTPAGMPAYLGGGAPKASAQSRVNALQQQYKTEDRDKAKELATRIGQEEVRDVMQAQDERAEQAAPPQGEQATAQGGLPAGAKASDFAGIEEPQIAGASPAEGQTAQSSGGGDEGDAAAGDPGAEGSAGAPGAAGAPGGAGSGAAGAGDGPQAEDLSRGSEPLAPQTGAGDLALSDLVLIDVELAEHERWASALTHVGAAGSEGRAQFVAEQVGSGFISGVASGAAMGLGIGLVSRAVPVLGPVLGGGMALHGLLSRDWAATGDTIAKFGEGEDIYDTLANTLASVSAIIDITTQVLDVITGIVGVVEGVAIGVAAGAGVLAFFTFGATAGIAVAAGELAITCEEIRQGVTIVSTALSSINNLVLNPCILLFRALHSFTSQADPREVEDGGRELSAAGSAAGGALGGWLGGHAAQLGGRAKPPPQEGAPTTNKPLHDSAGAAAPPAPELHYKRPAADTDAQGGAAQRPLPTVEQVLASPGMKVTDDAPAAQTSTQLSLPMALDAPAVSPAPHTGGQLKSTVEPLSLRNISAADTIPQGASEGAIGTYKKNVPNPHEVALASNPPKGNSPGGKSPKNGFDDANLYREHQAPAAVMAEVHPNYAYENAAGKKRAGSSVKEALTIGLPTAVKGHKDAADGRLLTEVRQRKANGEDVSGAEIIARGALHVQQAYDAASLPAPQQQISRQFLGEMEVMHGPRFGYDEFRPGEPPPAGKQSPLKDVSDAELNAHIDNLFGPFEHPMPPPGGQFSFPGMAPRPQAVDATAAPQQGGEQLALPFPSPQLDLFGPQAYKVADAPSRGTEPLSRTEFEAHAQAAVAMGMPRDQIHQAQGDTSYHPGYDALLIGPDVKPLPVSQRPTGLANPANAALGPQAAIGHEVIGHREAALGGQTRDDGWHEELQASARAALFTPGLTREQSWLLLQDAAARRRDQTREGEIYIDTGRYGPAAQTEPRTSTPRGPGDEPSVVIDPRVLEQPAQPGAPVAAPKAASPGASTPTASPTISQRAGQFGALVLPQLFGGGGQAPTQAQQQAAHRARFTEDNQPREGVTRVDPKYSAPPATPQQIVAIQNEVLNLLAVKARAEAEASHEANRVAACEANVAPIAATLADTRGGLSAITAHDQAIARRNAANQAQQQRQQEAAGLTAGYPDQAAGLAALTLPLAAWEGFTSLASHLPGSAGDRMAEMNAEAQQMQKAFEQMGSHMGHTDGQQPALQGGLRTDAARLGTTKEQALGTRTELQGAADGATGLRQANLATRAAAQARGDQATQRGQELADAAAQREATASSLAAQLQAWSLQHRAERATATEALVQRLQAQGYTVTQTPATV